MLKATVSSGNRRQLRTPCQMLFKLGDHAQEPREVMRILVAEIRTEMTATMVTLAGIMTIPILQENMAGMAEIVIATGVMIGAIGMTVID